MKKYFLIFLLLLSLPLLADAPGSFDAFFTQDSGIGFWGWVGIIAGTIAVGVITWVSCGTTSAAIPAWIQTVGTWVGATVYGLHGAAATSAGLALLGGGSIAAGGLGIKGGIVLLTILASTSTEIAIEYTMNEAIDHFSNNAFIEDSKQMTTFPLPINDSGSSSYEDSLEWILEKKEEIFDNKGVEFNIHDPEFQKILKEATIIFGRDMVGTDDMEEKVNNLTFLSLLYFQQSQYRNSFKYAKDAISCAKEKEEASLSQILYATSYLYSESADNNIEIQKEHLVPALLKEGSNKFTPFVLSVYLDRIMYRIHSGASKPEEILFIFDLLKNKKFSKNTTNCIPIFTVRILQEIKRCQKDIEVITANNNLSFMKKNNVSDILDIRYNNFVALKEALAQLLPYIKSCEKDFTEEYTFTSSNIEQQLVSFNNVESNLSSSIAETKKRIISYDDSESNEESKWWNPFSW